jgi:5-methylcytosine-specific restriction endonuclease McrA
MTITTPVADTGRLWRVFSVDGPEELLRDFVSRFDRDRRVGYRLDLCVGRLPPLTVRQAEAISELAHDWYWQARLCSGRLDRSKECLRVLPGALAAAVAEHRATKGKTAGGYRSNAHLREMLRERDGAGCWLCGHELGDDCTIEHKLATANGGTWAFGNLALAHRECNRSLGRLPVAAKEAARAELNREWENG